MDGHRFPVPAFICYLDDLHFFRRRLIPLNQYLQQVGYCWNSKSSVNRTLLERAILKEVKIANILKGIYRIRDLRRVLLEHKRLAFDTKIMACQFRVKKTRKIEYKTARLDPTVKVLAVIKGALVSCKGNNFRLRYAYSERTDNSTSVVDFVFSAEQPFPHETEENAFTNEPPTLREDNPCGSVGNSLEIRKCDDWRVGFHKAQCKIGTKYVPKFYEGRCEL